MKRNLCNRFRKRREGTEEEVGSSVSDVWFQMRFSLFWDVTQRRLVVSYRRFGINCRVPPSWPLKKEPIGRAETSVGNYQFTLRDIPEEIMSHYWCTVFMILSILFCFCLFPFLVMPQRRAASWLSVNTCDRPDDLLPDVTVQRSEQLEFLLCMRQVLASKLGPRTHQPDSYYVLFLRLSEKKRFIS